VIVNQINNQHLAKNNVEVTTITCSIWW